MSDALSKVIFKGFLPFADVIEDVSDERCNGDGIWVYPIRETQAAESVCAPSTLHEDTVKELVAQLKDVAAEIRANPDEPREWTEEEMDEAMEAEGEEEDRSGFIDDEGILWVDGMHASDGDVLVDFRGEKWDYKGIAQVPSPGKSGKVLVGDPFWTEDDPGTNERVFYPSCFVTLKPRKVGR